MTEITSENGKDPLIRRKIGQNNGNDSDIKLESRTPKVTTEQDDIVIVSVDIKRSALIYKISDSPPLHLTVFFAFQQCLVSIAGSIIACMLVAEAACALENGVFLRKLLSSAMLMNGITTLLQNTLGIRLPVYQGPTGAYALPLIALTEMDPGRCDVHTVFDRNSTEFVNKTESELSEMLIDVRVREMMGPLMLAGLFHCLIGATGLLGLLMRFIGPVTIVPTILLMGIYTVKPAMEYCQSHWGLSFMTWVISLILSLYLGHKPMPIPMWTRKRRFHILWYPLHQVFAILFAILIGWAVCGAMTSAGALTDDMNDVEYKSRTDAMSDVIESSEWIYIPYPGHFGWPEFSMNCLVGFLIATLTSILDSLGDYFATASTCRVPPPPNHAVNRGIAIEGFCTILAGIMGTGHGTTTYGGNIGAIGMTKVASRRVFIGLAFIYILLSILAKVCAVFVSIPYPVLGGSLITIVASRRVFIGLAFIYILLSILAKVCAVFVSIPYPVLGGSLITIVGAFVGFNLTNLQVMDLNSTRNLTIIGMAIFVGIMVPDWIKANSEKVQTGNDVVDQLVLLFLGNPNFFGGFLACFLDNTVPGTEDERGISAWKSPEEKSDNPDMYLEGSEIYDLPCGIQNMPYIRKLPLCRK